MTCTFFGHANTPLEIRDKLKTTLIDLIENRSVDLFYVGDKGNFDKLALSVLREISAGLSYTLLCCSRVSSKGKKRLPNAVPRGHRNSSETFRH